MVGFHVGQAVTGFRVGYPVGAAVGWAVGGGISVGVVEGAYKLEGAVEMVGTCDTEGCSVGTLLGLSVEGLIVGAVVGPHTSTLHSCTDSAQLQF